MIVSGRLWRAESSDFAQGWLAVEQGRIAASGWGEAGEPAAISPSGLIAPGFVDVHSHGGAGAAFTEGARAARTVLDAHRRQGTTTMSASLVSADLDEIVAQVEALAPLVASGELAGVHLEGPWISPQRKGAHDLGKLAAPTPAAVDRVLALAPGLVRMVTIAPELDCAEQAIRRLSAAGIVVALGHTAADYACFRSGFDTGASGVTHLFNAMPDLGKRDPGPVLAAWRDPRAWLELVFDGHHVDARLAAFCCEQFPERMVLITDAMAAAGMGDGDYTLGGLPVRVSGGVARLTSDGAIAGSTITLADALANAVANGIPLGTAVRLASANPAAYLGLGDVGRLTAGAKADLVELDESGRVLNPDLARTARS
ncbi:MAG: N-acetylglucosamine-6-phosphate deacetylase [Propionibacteriaceae bacterium]|jgi:N-acetylglucosamine-6-phosphate deacetylase|nr:N-acetylglucosamine-6-phosphate deacetylase [Propionibacteriaceae bacterium]